MLYGVHVFNVPTFPGGTPKTVIKTKRAWRAYFRKRPDDRVVEITAGQFQDDELHVSTSVFIRSLIENGTLWKVESPPLKGG